MEIQRITGINKNPITTKMSSSRLISQGNNKPKLTMRIVTNNQTRTNSKE